MTSVLGALHPYRVYAGRDRAARIANELRTSQVPFLVVKRDFHTTKPFWYVFEVTAELLGRLAQPGTVETVLDLHEPDGDQAVDRKVIQYGPARSDAPFVVLDDSGNPTGVVGAALEASQAEIYPELNAQPAHAEPDEIVEFELTLAATAPVGVSLPVSLLFAHGHASARLHASVSSTTFVPPKGAEWKHEFVIDRELKTLPVRWSFRARAIGERPLYSVNIRFICCGHVVGNAVATVARRPLSGVAEVPVSTSGRINTQVNQHPAVPATLEFTSQGADSYLIALYRNGEQIGVVPWNASELQSYGNDVEVAQSLQAVRDIGTGLMFDLPPEVQRFLDDPSLAGATTLIIAPGTLAPFEAIQLRPAQNGPMMGVDRPVVRWIGNTFPETTASASQDVVCIRPEYAGNLALKSAISEEEYLRKRHTSFTRVRTLADLRTALDTSTARLVHFAGHSDGNPARLSLEDGPARPHDFHPSSTLMRARPFLFLNGCRAGVGSVGIPSTHANMVKFLLQAGAKGIVAPMVQAQSTAALRAACAFYDAAAQGATIAEATRRVRELALQAPPVEAASFLSYLAFSAPTLTL